MYTLDVIDNRDEKTIQGQITKFKEELLQEIEFCHDDSKLETNLIDWIVANRVNQSILIGEHKREMGFESNLKADDIYDVPESVITELVSHSEKHKHVVFKLTYKPLDPYEAWVRYYKNGKMQQCGVEMVVPDFDEKKLKVIE